MVKVCHTFMLQIPELNKYREWRRHRKVSVYEHRRAASCDSLERAHMNGIRHSVILPKPGPVLAKAIATDKVLCGTNSLWRAVSLTTFRSASNLLEICNQIWGASTNTSHHSSRPAFARFFQGRLLGGEVSSSRRLVLGFESLYKDIGETREPRSTISTALFLHPGTPVFVMGDHSTHSSSSLIAFCSRKVLDIWLFREKRDCRQNDD